MVPSTAKAIVIKSKGQAAIETLPTPALRDEYILVHTTAVALNPTDFAHLNLFMGNEEGGIGSRLGCDYAGVVEEVGAKVTNGLQKGDRVFGWVHGANQRQHEDGAFGEYIAAKGDIQMKTPDNITDQEAATLGLGITTVGQSLYQALELPLPTHAPERAFPVLIYGGSTATGILAIQFAKASGLSVITTASPHNADYLRSLGADVVVDHHSASCADEIRAATGGRPIRHAMDCISKEPTAKVCAAALADDEEGGRYASLLAVDEAVLHGVNKHVKVHPVTLAYTVFGEDVTKLGHDIPANAKDWEFGTMFMALARNLVASGKVKPAKQSVNRGGQGLEGVLKGLDEIKQGKVSGEKLVYTL